MPMPSQSVKIILDSKLPRREKLVRLRTLETDLRQRSVAEVEGMFGVKGADQPRLAAYQRVRQARRQLRDPLLDPVGSDSHVPTRH